MRGLHSEAGLTLIVAWKAVKAAILVVAAFGLAPRLGMFSQLSDQNRTLVTAAMLALAALYLVEGTGLYLRKRWAVWLTLIPTAALIPVEIWRLVTRHHALTMAILIGNVLVIWYLAANLRAATFPPPRP